MMKPLVLIKLRDDIDLDERIKITEEANELSKSSLLGYDVLVYQNVKIKVCYPSKPISFYYHKLKIWLILKTKKKK